MHPSQYTGKDGKQHPNLTLINLTLRVCGPMSERRLVLVLLGLQAFCCGFGLFLRYRFALLLYGRL